MAYKYIHEKFITDETCIPYEALSHTEGRKCTEYSVCKECAPGNKCFVPTTIRKYKIKDYGSLSGEENMKKEIMGRGPIVCGVDGTKIENLSNFDIQTEKSSNLTQSVVVVGWGEDDGKKYWLARGTFGQYWAKDGYFRVARGDGGALGIESDCVYANPEKTWENDNLFANQNIVDSESLANEEYNIPLNIVEEIQAENKELNFGLIEEGELIDESVTPKPEDFINENDVPKSFFWGNVNNKNYLSWTVNQHIPQVSYI